MVEKRAGPAPSGLKRVRRLIWLLVGLAAMLLAFLLLRPGAQQEQPAVQSSLPGFTLGGPFTLIDSSGQPFSSAKLAGKPYALFFGFTHCPDVCPTTLARLARLRQQLGRGDDAFNIVFVTVDPERDDPEAVGAYAKLYGTPIIGLTGSRAQIDQVAKQHGIYHAKVAQADAPDGYTVDHGAAVLLFDKAGRFSGTIAQEEGDAPALDKLKRLAA